MIEVSYIMGHKIPSGGIAKGFVNQVGGSGVAFDLKNIGNKTIKYCDLYFEPYNAVGDKVYCNTTGQCEGGVRVTGPILPNNGSYGEVTEHCLWYNRSIKSVKLTRAEVEYTDGTKETIAGNRISSVGTFKKTYSPEVEAAADMTLRFLAIFIICGLCAFVGLFLLLTGAMKTGLLLLVGGLIPIVFSINWLKKH